MDAHTYVCNDAGEFLEENTPNWWQQTPLGDAEGRGFEHGGQRGHQLYLQFKIILTETILMYDSWNLKICAWEDLFSLLAMRNRGKSSLSWDIWSHSISTWVSWVWWGSQFNPNSWSDLRQIASPPTALVSSVQSDSGTWWPTMHYILQL